MDLDLSISFDKDNADHKKKLADILTKKGILPSNPKHATEIKEAVNGANLEKLNDIVEAYLNSKQPAQPAQASQSGLAIRKGKSADSGYMLAIYGQPGIGKSTLASLAPKALFLDIEGGVSRIECDSVETKTWTETEKNLELFMKQNEYQTLVFDTVDVLEKRLWQHICRINKWRSIESPGYGRGYAEALEHWVVLLEKCRVMARMGKNIIFTAHSDIKTFLNPEGESYDRHNLKLHKNTSEHFFGQMDAVLFCHFDSFVKKNSGGDSISITSGDRLISTCDTMIAQVKNRFGLPPKIPMNADLFRSIK